MNVHDSCTPNKDWRTEFFFFKCGQVFFLDFGQGPRKRLWLSGTENLGTKLQMCTHKVVENLNGWSCKVRLPYLYLNWYLPGNTRAMDILHSSTSVCHCERSKKVKKKKTGRLMNKVVWVGVYMHFFFSTTKIYGSWIFLLGFKFALHSFSN